ncbi:transcription initiation factor IIB [Thraustotheca clavata]|uniref:General transcription factor TFIIB n=1 Tax=Thraustotheca clavata TaxID=74557 RepID=A0A1V9ZCA8_9STRA|nr:transcription initiation factor IIB [Thraustotheca clavata]
MESHCFACGSDDLVEDYAAGDLVCRGCGMVLIEHLIDDSPEWNNYMEDDRDREDQNRVGSALDERTGATSLETYIAAPPTAKKSKGDIAKPFHLSQTAQVLRRKEGFTQLRDYCDTLQVNTTVAEYAISLYAKLDGLEDFALRRQSNKNRLYAAILYISCRDCGNTRSYKELENMTGVDKFKIGKMVTQITQANVFEQRGPTPRVKSEDFLARFCSSLNLPTKTRIIASPIVEKATKMGLVEGKAPHAIAAGVIYIVAAFTNAKRSVEEVSQVTSVTANVVKEVAKALNKSKKDLFADVPEIKVA